MGNKKRAVVALSGGIDSSVTALLLQQQGFEVVGLTMRINGSKGTDIVVEKARKVAEKLNIEHKVLDVSREFQLDVIDYFKNALKNGETPNPCARCNKFVKWGALFNYAINELNAEYFSTGHYANLKEVDGVYKLYPSLDRRKDQLYFLFSLTQDQLSKTIFPLSQYVKAEIRQIAIENNLPSKDSKESQDICFIEKPKTLKEYLIEEFGEKTGDFIDIKTGKKLGEHQGFFHYTIGQRKGIGIAAETPLYVIKVDSEKNIVYLGKKDKAWKMDLKLRDIKKAYPFEGEEFEVMTKIRYNMDFVSAKVKIKGTEGVMEFHEPVYSITPGQAAVFYDKNDGHLLGGGWIVR